MAPAGVQARRRQREAELAARRGEKGVAEAGLAPPYRGATFHLGDGRSWHLDFGEVQDEGRPMVPALRQGTLVVTRGEALLPLEEPVSGFLDLGALSFQPGDADSLFVDEPAPAVLAKAVAAIESDIGARLPDDYISEVSLAAPAWLADVVQMLEHGMVMLFDYGVSRREYYAADRHEGWLRCHFRHRAHSDPLILPGIQDLTAWVDFSAIADAAVNAGLEILGYLSQAQFLLAAGIEAELHDFAEMPIESQLQTAAQIKMLTLPGEMGENVKCLCLARGDIPSLTAFDSADRTHTL